MSRSLSQCVIKLHEEHHALEDYQGGVPRWCSGCGDNAILAAMQRLCSDEDLAPENTVFSGARFSSLHRRCIAARMALSPQPLHQRGTPPW